jgi:hypothetical protein
MVAAEPTLARQAQDAQHAGHGAHAGREDGTEQEGAGVALRALAEEHRERYDHGDEVGWQCRHESPLWPEGASVCRVARFVTS